MFKHSLEPQNNLKCDFNCAVQVSKLIGCDPETFRSLIQQGDGRGVQHLLEDDGQRASKAVALVGVLCGAVSVGGSQRAFGLFEIARLKKKSNPVDSSS